MSYGKAISRINIRTSKRGQYLSLSEKMFPFGSTFDV